MFQTMWRLHPRGPANRGVCVDADGAVLGPDCVLVRRTASGYRSTGRQAARDVQGILLSEQDDPDWLFGQGRRIVKALDRGELALAQIYGLRIPVRPLDERQLKQLAGVASFAKFDFDPAEPRIPAGQPGGGEWTGGGGIGAENLEAHLIEAGYNLTPDLWTIIRNLYKIYMAPGSTLASLEQYPADNGLNFDELPSVIKSLFDAPKPLADLQTDKPPQGFATWAQLEQYLGDPPPGYEWHHIIEQNGQWRPDLTSPEGIQTWIQNTDNVVTVPMIKHYCISGIMSTRFPGSDLRVRDVVRFHNPLFQRYVGLDLLRRCGAIQ